MKVEWVYEAQKEFQELLAYHRAAAGEEVARIWADRVLGAVEALADAPRAGVLRREGLLGRHGFRTLRVDQYACIYRIEEGVVRIYHLADASRGNLASLLGIRESAPQRAHRPMLQRSVFLRSTLRQPVRALLLAVVAALISFAYVSRTSEYLLIRRETERLGSYYRTVGTLESAIGDQWTDTSQAAAYLESHPSVRAVDTYNYLSAYMEEDFCNTDTDLLTSDLSRYLVFYGTLWSCGSDYIHFTVDTVISGMPDLIFPENYSVILHPTADQGTVYPEETLAELRVGERYLAVGYYSLLPPSSLEYDPATGRQTATHALLSCPLEDGLFRPVPAGEELDWSDPRLGDTGEFIQEIIRAQRTLNVIPTRDMRDLPITQESDPRIYLTEGRWLDSRDNDAQRRVCVISQSLAALRGLSVGDELTLTLRDLPSTFGYYRPHLIDESLFLRPIEFSASGRVYQGNPLSDTRHLFVSPGQVETATDTYEIVGIYGYRDKYRRTVVYNFAYIPAAAVPESFSASPVDTQDPEEVQRFSFIQDRVNLSNPLPAPGSVSFVLTSPEEDARFMSDVRGPLASMGFQVTLLENGWASFQAASQPMVRSSLYNGVIFTALMVVTVCLIALVYFRLRRKDIAIARALGVPVRRCTVEAALPLLLVGLPGIALGGGLGWRYTLDNAGTTLHALSELQGSGGAPAALSGWWLALLLGGAAALLAAAAVGGSACLSARPVLNLLQGGQTGRERRQAEPAESAVRTAPPPPAGIPAAPLRRVRQPAAAGGSGAAPMLRFVWRHIVRSRLKTALAVSLAAGFTIGLAAIRLSIAGSQAEIDWLYENTRVEAELLLGRTNQSLGTSGFLRRDVVRQLLDTGYITDVYLEGATRGAVVQYDPILETRGAGYIPDDGQTRQTVRAFSDESVFLSPAGSGGAVTITYLDGWDGSLFAQDWSDQERFPLVLPLALFEEYGGGPDGAVGFVCKSFRICQVVGYYTGDVAGEDGETDPILLPLSAYEMMCGRRMATYSKAHVTLAPALNRELDQFHALLSSAAASQNAMMTLRAVIWDEELRLAVAPLERSVELMEVLYPVTLAMSLLAAAGIAVLFVMTSAREAAILRVLGTSKLRSRLMLALQTVLTSLAGLLAGVLGALAYTARTRPELLAGLVGASVLCALLYLLSAVIGAAVSAVGVTGKNPLELLQVRE